MKAWSYESYRSSAQEGSAEVPGAALSYRLAGPATAASVVVFESGWTPAFPYAAWLEDALVPNVRMLSYDRAGIGDSRSSAPLTAAAVTQQLRALLSTLRIDRPVLVTGHSYGGLIAALHAAQAPEIVRAIVQIDPTPELPDPIVDSAMRIMPLTARILQLCALLRLDGPLFLDLANELPPEIFARVKRNPRWLVRSLNGSIAEIRLLAKIRELVSASEAARRCPRLVISGTREAIAPSRLQRLLIDDQKAHNYWEAVDALHRRQAAQNGSSRWMSLPYNHVSLVTRRASADQVASEILRFLR